VIQDQFAIRRTAYSTLSFLSDVHRVPLLGSDAVPIKQVLVPDVLSVTDMATSVKVSFRVAREVLVGLREIGLAGLAALRAHTPS